jgi:hypothetical protein
MQFMTNLVKFVSKIESNRIEATAEAGALLIVSNRIDVTEEAGVPCLCGGGGGGGDCRDMHSKIN